MIILDLADGITNSMPREIVFLFFAGFCVYLSKNWSSLSKKELFSEYSVKESISWGLILFCFIAIVLILGDGAFIGKWSESIGVISLGFGFSFILIRIFISFFLKQKVTKKLSFIDYIEFLVISSVLIFLIIFVLIFLKFPGVSFIQLPVFLLLSLIILEVFNEFVGLSSGFDLSNIFFLAGVVIITEIIFVPFIINALT